MVKICNCSKKEFEKIIKYKKIIAICAGEDFLKFCKEYNAINRITIIADNRRRNEIEVSGVAKGTIPIEEIKDFIDENTILVLTSLLYSDQLLEQLDTIPELEGMNTYIPQLITEEKVINRLPEISYAETIPKKIHYCWFGGKEIPDNFKRYIESWYDKCPDYEIIRWDESNYDVSKNQYMYEAYKAEKWGFVPDFARLDIILHHGGFYLDTDVELLQSLDKLRKYGFVCGFESWDYVALGLGFGAVAGNQVILEMMREYENLHFVDEEGNQNLTASPVYQTEYLVRKGLIPNGELQIISDGIVLPTEYLCPVDTLGNGEISNNSISIHHYAGTWLDEKSQQQKDKKKSNRLLLLSRVNDENER